MPGSRVYIPHEHGVQVITPGIGFPFCGLLRLAGTCYLLLLQHLGTDLVGVSSIVAFFAPVQSCLLWSRYLEMIAR
jgi:hypothetical protein